MKLFTKVILSTVLTVAITQACTEIFINKNGKHVVGRNQEFGTNVIVENAVGYIG